MRVIAGRYGGRRLQAPPGGATRPTADRVREALFSILGARVEGAAVLDLFAGSGALGLEALSRGAVRATFVESAPAAQRALRANVEALGADAELVRADACAGSGAHARRRANTISSSSTRPTGRRPRWEPRSRSCSRRCWRAGRSSCRSPTGGRRST